MCRVTELSVYGVIIRAQGLEIIAGFYVILEQAGIILIQQECMMDLNVLC